MPSRVPHSACHSGPAHLGVGDQHLPEHVRDGAVLGLTADVKAAVIHDVGGVGPVLVTLGLQGNRQAGVRLGRGGARECLTGRMGWTLGQSSLTGTRGSESRWEGGKRGRGRSALRLCSTAQEERGSQPARRQAAALTPAGAPGGAH